MLVNLTQVRERLNATRQLVFDLEEAENKLLYPTEDSEGRTVELKERDHVER